MISQIESIKTEVENYKITDKESLEKFRIQYLSKKGKINLLFNDFKKVSPDEKKEVGLKINELKQNAQHIYNSYQLTLNEKSENRVLFDPFATKEPIKLGSRHPISKTLETINEIFGKIGFSIAEGPEIEDDRHVFSALNFPPEHPARDMQDTFFIEKNPDILLRTHTSSVQVRIMENEKPPIRKLMPGRVFRNEAISSRSHCIFHQVEGLYINEHVSFADLKQLLLYFAKELFGKDSQIRLRPSYFPFTEPSAEVDVSCTLCKGKGCKLCKYTGWLEIMGCGMVDPNVLEESGINPKQFSGYAFGMGIERIALLLYSIPDIRMYFENDVRFLKQFASIQ